MEILEWLSIPMSMLHFPAFATESLPLETKTKMDTKTFGSVDIVILDVMIVEASISFTVRPTKPPSPLSFRVPFYLNEL